MANVQSKGSVLLADGTTILARLVNPANTCILQTILSRPANTFYYPDQLAGRLCLTRWANISCGGMRRRANVQSRNLILLGNGIIILPMTRQPSQPIMLVDGCPDQPTQPTIPDLPRYWEMHQPARRWNC